MPGSIRTRPSHCSCGRLQPSAKPVALRSVAVWLRLLAWRMRTPPVDEAAPALNEHRMMLSDNLGTRVANGVQKQIIGYPNLAGWIEFNHGLGSSDGISLS